MHSMVKPLLILGILILGVFIFPNIAQSQEFSFQTWVSYNNSNTQTCSFGLREEALPGLDPFDIPSPPPSPDNSLHAFLSMMAPPPAFPNQWLADFRPIQNQALNLTEFWILELNHDFPGGTATIFIDQPSTLPIPYELWLHQPDSSSSPVAVPGAVEISLDASTLIFFWELRIEGSVPANSSTWGGVKSLYR